MEITIVIGRGESLQDVLRRTRLNPVGPMTLTLTSETQKDVVAPQRVVPQTKPAGKKRGRPKGSRNKKAKKAKVAKLEMKSGAWTQKESIWMANQPRPTEAKTAKIGRTKVSPIEVLFAEKFGYRRTFKSLASKWNRMNKK
tara:strand:+ start:208 stop:630 length:423 start_codon:yes stop_codon:yes gene_type:complete